MYVHAFKFLTVSRVGMMEVDNTRPTMLSPKLRIT